MGGTGASCADHLGGIPDGAVGTLVSPSALVVINVDGSTPPRPLVRVRSGRLDTKGGSSGAIGMGSWSPDGRRIAFASACSLPRDNPPACSLSVVNADGADAREFASTSAMWVGLQPLWAPNNREILIADTCADTPGCMPRGGVYAVNADSGVARPIWDFLRSASLSGLAVSPAGRIAFVAGTCCSKSPNGEETVRVASVSRPGRSTYGLMLFGVPRFFPG